MKKILDVSIPDVAVPWQRTRGKTVRYTHERVRVWKYLVHEHAANEIEMSGVKFDHEGPFRLSVTLRLPRRVWHLAGDSDNYEKAIMDALKGLVWRDDKVRYIPEKIFKAEPVDDDEDVVTKVEVWVTS